MLSSPSELAVYDCDGLTLERAVPDAVVFPRTTAQVSRVMRVCGQHGAAVVARGAGTSLAGGCTPLVGGVVIMLTRMNRILEVNLRDRMAVVEAGVPNIQLARRLAGTGYHYAPDPSSQGASTIGGNVATNAGGPHTLQYGVTVNHLLGVEAVLADGRVLEMTPPADPAQFDLPGLLCGSEGTLAVVTKAWVRLTRNPEDCRTMRAVFDTVDQATETVSRIIAAGIIPSALELMDRGILGAVEAAFHFGFPPDADAILIIEVDGPRAAAVDDAARRVVEICRENGAREVIAAATEQERTALWKCRKLSVGAVGRLSNSYMIQDGVVPRTRLPSMLRHVARIAEKYDIRIVNVAHAGDGNIHPILLFDERNRDEVRRAVAAGRELLEQCIAEGGSVTAEHGIGLEKIELMKQLFRPSDLQAMRHVRHALDPDGRMNPGKLLPSAAGQ